MITRLRVSAVEPPAGLWGGKTIQKKLCGVDFYLCFLPHGWRDANTSCLQCLTCGSFIWGKIQFCFISTSDLLLFVFDDLDLNPKLCLGLNCWFDLSWVVFPLNYQWQDLQESTEPVSDSQCTRNKDWFSRIIPKIFKFLSSNLRLYLFRYYKAI